MISTGGELVLVDHVVDGVPACPAVGYLQLVREAIDAAIDATLGESRWPGDSLADVRASDLPCAIGDVEPVGGAPHRAFSHMTLRSAARPALEVDVTLTDEDGRMLVRVSDTWLRAGSTQNGADAAMEAGSVFVPRWTRSPPASAFPATGPDADLAGPLLLLAATPDAADQLVRAVKDRLPQSRPVMVTPGPVLRLKGDQATVRRDGDDLAVLVDMLGAPVRAVVYAWPDIAADGASPDLRYQRSDGLTPLVGLLRALVTSALREPVRLLCAVSGTVAGQPAHQAVAGLLRTAHGESPRLSWRLLEIPAATLAALGGDGSAADLIGSELAGRWDDDRETRYRAGQR